MDRNRTVAGLDVHKDKSLSLEKSNERGKIMMAALVFNDL